jgi:hypothetical protein
LLQQHNARRSRATFLRLVTAVVADVCAGKTLFLRVAELVPHHPMRSQEALAAKKAAAEQHERQIKAAEKAAAGGSSGGTKPAKSGNKKKNRK